LTSKFTLKDKIYQELLLLTANDEFMKDVKALRKKCKDESCEAVDDITKKPFWFDYASSAGYTEDIIELREKYNLSKFYQIPLILFCNDDKDKMPDLRKVDDLWKTNKPEGVLVINDPDTLTLWKEMDPSFPLDEILGETERRIVLNLYPETTKKDIIEDWPKISKERDRLWNIESSRNPKRTNLKRDLRIYKLKKQGKTCMEITKIINENDKYKKQKISYEEVSKIIKRLENRANKLGATKKT